MAKITVISRVAHTSPDQHYRNGGEEYECEEAEKSIWADAKIVEVIPEVIPEVIAEP